MCKFDVGSLILHISSSCFWFFFDCLRLLKKNLFVSVVSTCFTVMLDCFKWFGRFMVFWDVFGLYVLFLIDSR